MNIKLTDKAKAALKESEVSNYKINIIGDGWAGPVFGLVQGESDSEDAVISVDGVNFAVEKEFEDVIDYFDIDYYNGVFKKGFVVYANGLKGC